MTQNPRYVWHDGKLVPWDSATMHLTEMAIPAVAAVFEGLRAYASPDNRRLHVIGLDEHLRRLARSTKFMRLAPDYGQDALRTAILDLLQANECRTDSYVRVLVYFLGAGLFSSAAEPDTHYLITTGDGESSLLNAQVCHACVSSWRRIGVQMQPPQVKAVCNYLNSRLAAMEALRNGYDDAAILLNEWGKVSEGPGECVFLVRNGALVTPDVASGILESITREYVIQLGRDALGIPVEERQVERAELYFADEAFYAGTSSELRPIGSVDRYTVGNGQVGVITRKLERLYHDIVRGLEDRYSHWRTTIVLEK